MNEGITIVLYGLVGFVVFAIVSAGLAIFIIKKTRQKRRATSLSTTGSDESDYADLLSEKLRNERMNEDW